MRAAIKTSDVFPESDSVINYEQVKNFRIVTETVSRRLQISASKKISSSPVSRAVKNFAPRF